MAPCAFSFRCSTFNKDFVQVNDNAHAALSFYGVRAFDFIQTIEKRKKKIPSSTGVVARLLFELNIASRQGLRLALHHGHLQHLNDALGALLVRHRPAQNPPAEHVENDSQVQEAAARRHVADIGDPQAIWCVGMEVPLDPIRCRRNLRISTRRARRTATTHTGHADGRDRGLA